MNWLEGLLSDILPALKYLFQVVLPQVLFPRADEVKDNKIINEPMPTPEPIQPPIVIAPPNPDALLPWTTPENCRHNCRAIADLEGLTVSQKNTMSQVIHCESGYSIHAKHDNKTSVDHGICQWNSFFHASEITPYQAENDPEKAVRLMCQYVKAGKINQWVCYSRGYYKNYTA